MDTTMRNTDSYTATEASQATTATATTETNKCNAQTITYRDGVDITLSVEQVKDATNALLYLLSICHVLECSTESKERKQHCKVRDQKVLEAVYQGQRQQANDVSDRDNTRLYSVHIQNLRVFVWILEQNVPTEPELQGL
jgi:hypothetical protein